MGIKEKIDNLVAENKWMQAIEELTTLTEQEERPWMDRYLCRLRMDAYKSIAGDDVPAEISEFPPRCDDPFPTHTLTLPEIDASELSVDLLRGSLKHHGALIVRGLISNDKAGELTQGIDKVISQSAEYYKDNKVNENYKYKDPWFNPISKKEMKEIGIKMLNGAGAIFAPFSPKMTRMLFSLYNEINLKPLVRDYFDHTPCLSIKKWVLRRMSPLSFPGDWHQDGSFMGKEVKSLNLWMALSECGKGTNKAGMDFIPRRMKEIVPTGTDGAYYKWSISNKYVQETFKDTPPYRPYFNAGDGIFFDHMNLHCTTYDEAYTDIRYAIETWFFAQGQAPKNQLPIVW